MKINGIEKESPLTDLSLYSRKEFFEMTARLIQHSRQLFDVVRQRDNR